MLWTRTLYMFSAILHDCPKQAVQDRSCSRATHPTKACPPILCTRLSTLSALAFLACIHTADA
jgi:hypothetical protein